MLACLQLLRMFVADLFRPRRQLEVENLFLRHQLNIALRGAPHRPRLRGSDRALLILMTWLWPSLLSLSRIVQPDTILRWHRAGFRTYWRWKSRGRPGRPRIGRELRELIQRMSKENPLWGAPRIHGELLKLGFEIAESTVSKYMIRRRGPPSQTWRTFLRNHAEAIAAIDLCVVPTLTFECLFAFLVVGHGRRQIRSRRCGLRRSARPSRSATTRDPNSVGEAPLRNPTTGIRLLRARLSLRGRVLEEEAQHLSRGVRALRIGVGANGAASRPSMSGSMDVPVLKDCPPARVGMDSARI